MRQSFVLVIETTVDSNVVTDALKRAVDGIANSLGREGHDAFDIEISDADGTFITGYDYDPAEFPEENI